MLIGDGEEEEQVNRELSLAVGTSTSRTIQSKKNKKETRPPNSDDIDRQLDQYVSLDLTQPNQKDSQRGSKSKKLKE